MSKEEGLCTVERLYIPVILVRIDTSSNSVETFRHWQKPKNEAIHNHADSLLIQRRPITSFSFILSGLGLGD